MKTMSVSEFCAANNLVEVAKSVRANSNGYQFITFMDDNNVALNLYLSKSLCDEIPEGAAIIKGFFKDKVVVETENGEGETRLKLAHKDSQRLDLSDIL